MPCYRLEGECREKRARGMRCLSDDCCSDGHSHLRSERGDSDV